MLFVPSWPSLLAPQASTAPLALTARLCVPPAAIPATPDPSVATAIGSALSAVPLVPSWPYSFHPQAYSDPSQRRARL